MQQRKLKPFAKLVIVVLTLGGLYGGYRVAESKGLVDSIAPKNKPTGEIAKGTFNFGKPTDKAGKLDRPLKVGVVTWGGYAGGEFFNGGFKASEESRYFRDYGLKVEFVVNDDVPASREAFKAGAVDVLWTTVDAFTTEVDGMKDLEPKIIFQADWSRGGDAVVVRRGINTVADLKGKKIAFAGGTPSNTFLLWLLDAGDLQYTDIDPVVTGSVPDAAQAFKAGKVDAAVVWSPDDEDCIKSIAGAKVMKSTREATNIIPDVFFVRNQFLQAHKDELKSLVEGWLIGSAEINSSDDNRRKAAKILAQGLNVAEDFAYKAIGNARLTTYGDNQNFFNTQGSYSGVKGEDVYNTMAVAYNKLNLAPSRVPNWRSVTDTSVLNAVSLEGRIHVAEGGVKFTKPSEEHKTMAAFSTKRVTITFPTGSHSLDENTKYIIQAKFGDIARSFAKSRIRIEGNTDNVGSEAVNRTLSQMRAKAVSEFLLKEYKFDPNRFIVVGNGPSKPVADNSTPEGRSKNRRTDFELVSDVE
jgi:NitT/TauT family transport system substrate-binding protein